MYAFIIIILIGVAAGLIISGARRRHWLLVGLGAGLALLTAVFFGLLDIWGELLWFKSVGYSSRFWKVISTKIIVAVVGAVLGLAWVALLTWNMPKRKRFLQTIAMLLAAYIAGKWTMGNWDTILLFQNRVATGVTDPILSRDTGFYLFILPLYEASYGLLATLSVLALATSVAAVLVRIKAGDITLQEIHESDLPSIDQYRPLYLSGAGLLFVLAWGKYLDRFRLMYSPLGVVTGPGWTDAHVRLPIYIVCLILAVIAGIILIMPQLRDGLANWLVGTRLKYKPIAPLLVLGGTMIITWFILLAIVPALFQWLKVQPNEITMERPYIEHNIEFTRRGFGLHAIEEKRFPVSERFSRETVEQNRNLFDNIRLWDWRALDSVYKQFQEIRLYYEFSDVDIDRYMIQDRYRQVMVSAREMQAMNLPAQSQTFVNKRFKYTHGNGLTLTTVSDFTPEGLPNLLIKDIPPTSVYPELEVSQPRIYYGELTDSHVIVNTAEKELDYPRGEQNVYVNYGGSGGVQISNLWRKFLFGWKFDGTRLFLSDYPTSESRIMFHRNIRDRVKTIAPFLRFDDDPYIVLAQGKLYWIVDAYTVSADYPYSEPLAYQTDTGVIRRRMLSRRARQRDELSGANYIRNSVKAVVDAFEGSVDFYIFEEEDPLIQVWSKVFPGLFKGRDEMPELLLAHIRYPADILLIQGLVYAKYHMTDPAVFYNQEDLWVRATEKYYNQTQKVQPYYIIWEMPGSNDPQFVLMLPFTPKNKQVLIAWIAGMCDPAHYGRLLAYKFPKEKRVLGTQQVETKIDQDPVLSGKLSLWDQRGSRVIRGNVLAIPIEDTLIYVEPIYLQAETAAYPELRLVAIMHNDNLSYAETFDAALYGLFGEKEANLPDTGTPMVDASVNQLVQEANRSFENYLDAIGDKKFQDAAASLQSLSESLEQLLKTVESQEETTGQD